MKISKQDSTFFSLFSYYVQGDPQKEQYCHFYCGEFPKWVSSKHRIYVNSDKLKVTNCKKQNFKNAITGPSVKEAMSLLRSRRTTRVSRINEFYTCNSRQIEKVKSINRIQVIYLGWSTKGAISLLTLWSTKSSQNEGILHMESG